MSKPDHLAASAKNLAREQTRDKGIRYCVSRPKSEMHWRIVILVCAIGTIPLLWRYWPDTPNPIALWREASVHARYSDKWPISESDFATAKGLVEQHLGWQEIITHVTVTGPDEIEIHTTYWRIFSQERSGQTFIVRKANGEWAIDKVKGRMSLGAMF